MNSPRFLEVKEQLQKLFTFRMWLDSGEREYCGCKIDKKVKKNSGYGGHHRPGQQSFQDGKDKR